MDTYLVGGAVRDELLGRPVHERDYVVVGSSEREMIERGFTPVGRDFPVFLHPESADEYALARTERRTGRGHRGFECDTESVTLEQDLTRRDLTINAIARDHRGELIDPVGGMADLEARRLRHISPAFGEDPLRVLRVARFAAALAEFGFAIAPETEALMRQMVAGGELEDLTPERVHQEIIKAVHTNAPAVFFDVIGRLGGDRVLWPELDPAGIDRLRDLAALTSDEHWRIAALLLESATEAADKFAARYRFSRKQQDFVRHARRLLADYAAIESAPAERIVDCLYDTDAFRQSERFNDIVRFAAVRTGVDQAVPALWIRAREALAAIDRTDVAPELEGPAIGAAIRAARVSLLESLR